MGGGGVLLVHNEIQYVPIKVMVGKKWYVMYYIMYQYFFPTITYRYIMYFFRTFKKSTAPYKVHNMGLWYIKRINLWTTS